MPNLTEFTHKFVEFIENPLVWVIGLVFVSIFIAIITINSKDKNK